jgi:hypothetical protein
MLVGWPKGMGELGNFKSLTYRLHYFLHEYKLKHLSRCATTASSSDQPSSQRFLQPIVNPIKIVLYGSKKHTRLQVRNVECKEGMKGSELLTRNLSRGISRHLVTSSPNC